MTLRILVTGSRAWTDREAIKQAIATVGREAGVHPQEAVVIHGGARGADTIAAEVAREFGCHVETVDADWDTCSPECRPGHQKPRRNGGFYCPAAGVRRNTALVASGADICLAFPLGESRGTRNCMQQARRAGIPVVDHDSAVKP